MAVRLERLVSIKAKEYYRKFDHHYERGLLAILSSLRKISNFLEVGGQLMKKKLMMLVFKSHCVFIMWTEMNFIGSSV